MARLFEREWEHPALATRARLNVFEQPDGGFLVTEDRPGGPNVVKTLGLFDGREAALACAERRGRELERQRFRPAAERG